MKKIYVLLISNSHMQQNLLLHNLYKSYKTICPYLIF